MATENKVNVVAPILVETEVENLAKEKASTLAFPEEKQADLQYIRSILVSAGTNKNGAHFLPSEMMKAHNTIVHKAIDIEHEEDKVVGHIYDCAFLFKNGEVFDPTKLMADYKESSKSPDNIDIDIAIAGIIHKARFPNVSEEIGKGDWKVSMECFFKDFDLLIGNEIITRKEAQSLGYDADSMIGGFVKVMAGTKLLGKHLVARVLRDIHFSGMGIVKNPANPHSIILETAAHREILNRPNLVIDLQSIDNLRGKKIEIKSEKAKSKVENKVDKLDNLIEVKSIIANSVSEEQIYVELDKETGGVKRVLSLGGKEGAALRFTGPGIGGPGTILSYPDEICKSFKKRATKFNALDQSEAVVLHEHWCALFEEACPVIGASSKAPECLRNQRNSVTRDLKDTTINKTIREHLSDGPGNTFTTILKPERTPDPERASQVSRIREQAQSLRNSLRDFVAAEKKTSK